MSRLESGARKRIRLVAAIFAVAFVVVVGRAFYLQVMSTDKWQKLAERQYHKTLEVPAPRGSVFDHNGEPLAVSMEVDSIFLEPRRVVDPAQEAQTLASTLNLPYDLVKEKLSADKGFLWLKRQVTPDESERVRALKITGVNFRKEHRRYYPNAQLGAQLVGFTGLDAKGLEGVELKYERTLRGQGSDAVTLELDGRGRGLGSSNAGSASLNAGNNLYLTIDKNLQYIAEKELAAGVASSGSRAGCVIVLEATTGKILAMANNPDFNPNAVARHSPQDWRNRALVDAFEPGSTAKVFLVAAALNEGVVQPNQLIDCENGSYAVGGKVIHDHSPRGLLTVTEVLKYSSNIGSAKIGKRLERQRLHRYLTEFGFGAPTGVDLPGEIGGMLRKPNNWFEIDLAAISFGQGLTATPLQIATAMTAITNGGNLMQPYVVERVVAADGEVIAEHQPKVQRQVVSREVANTVRNMLLTVTEKGGTGTLAEVPGYRSAGKTGTAQKADPVTGGYSADKRVATFVGFIPAEAPKLIILALLDEPKGQVYGGLIAAPIFSRVASQSLQYLGIPPTYPEDRSKLLPSPESVANALQFAQADQTDAIGTLIDNETDAPAPMNDGPLMPNFLGLSSRQVLQLIAKTGVDVKLVGSGRVVEQQPIAGLPIPTDSEVWVRLEAPAETAEKNMVSAL